MTHPPDFFEKKFGMSIHERAAKLMAEEIEQNPEPGWWYLSYAGPEGWRGGTIVQAHGFVGACDYARRHGITPGPDTETQGHPVPPEQEPPEPFRNRLLTRPELQSFWGPMMSVREYEEEQKNAQRD